MFYGSVFSDFFEIIAFDGKASCVSYILIENNFNWSYFLISFVFISRSLLSMTKMQVNSNFAVKSIFHCRNRLFSLIKFPVDSENFNWSYFLLYFVFMSRSLLSSTKLQVKSNFAVKSKFHCRIRFFYNKIKRWFKELQLKLFSTLFCIYIEILAFADQYASKQ